MGRMEVLLGEEIDEGHFSQGMKEFWPEQKEFWHEQKRFWHYQQP